MNFRRESFSRKWAGLFLLVVGGAGLLNYMLSGFDGAQENFRSMGIDAYVLVQGYSHGLPVVRRLSDTAASRPLFLAMPVPAGAYLRSGDRVIKVAGANRMQIVRDSAHVHITTEWGFVDPPGTPLVKRTRTTR
ncbi:hypothetical protein ACFP2F_21605 [Hymenobacter artigasi]|uniref:Uncharacterized protein n=1 Tax=Hymenobacter artigasi TaxID=2719616 RepID=A0ABX1HPQ9_9BACT|nr:hypothetical protein [Hymenobacter artigasi]NKI91870.1 hypothetical protein [Hymenobacter artigasi]